MTIKSSSSLLLLSSMAERPQSTKMLGRLWWTWSMWFAELPSNWLQALNECWPIRFHAARRWPSRLR